MSELDPTAKELGFDRRANRGTKNKPGPEREHLYRSAEFWLSKRFAAMDRYLKTQIGSDEALTALAECSASH